MSFEENKEVVRRFNFEVIQQGRRASFDQLMAASFVNHSTPEGAPNDRESMWTTFHNILRPALSQLRVTIHDQIAEGDKVTTKKQFQAYMTARSLVLPPLVGPCPSM